MKEMGLPVQMVFWVVVDSVTSSRLRALLDLRDELLGRARLDGLDLDLPL